MSVHTDPRVYVGVTGHRPNRLVGGPIADLRSRVRETVSAIITASPTGLVTILSPLAEGTDRIVAIEALAAGCDLIFPLPFPRDEYLQDFATPVSQAEYRALLGRAREVIELSGSRDTPESVDAAYAAAGQYLVGASDLLIAIWDGGSARGSGGTADVVAAAVACRVPVIWIDSLVPRHVRVVTTDGGRTHDDGTLDDLAQLIAERPRRASVSITAGR